MALTQRLEFRQSQSLVMTPQLMQAIKLLQLSNLDLSAFVEEELERNPLLERASDGVEAPVAGEPAEDGQVDFADLGAVHGDDPAGEPSGSGAETFEPVQEEWMNRDLGSRAEIEQTLDAPLDNVFSEEPAETAARNAQDAAPTAYTEWGGGASNDDSYNLEAFVAAEVTLGSHLAEQLAVAFTAPAQRMIGQYLIDLVDEAGYLPPDLGQAAERLGARESDVEAVLAVLQRFDPPGVCARTLSECLAIQLRELNRYDPAMQALVEHLDLLAKRDIAALRKLCGVDDEDIADMIGEIRRLDPKPGLKFGASRVQTMVPDVYVRPGPDGGWHVELNSDTLPRVLVNQIYYTALSKTIRKDGDKSYFTDCLQNATWLVRALDQRARTILKVATEIVRQQDGFFTYGVAHLRPLNLKAGADADVEPAHDAPDQGGHRGGPWPGARRVRQGRGVAPRGGVRRRGGASRPQLPLERLLEPEAEHAHRRLRRLRAEAKPLPPPGARGGAPLGRRRHGRHRQAEHGGRRARWPVARREPRGRTAHRGRRDRRRLGAHRGQLAGQPHVPLPGRGTHR